MDTDVKDIVRQKYGEAARRVSNGAKGTCRGPVSSCCGAASATIGGSDPITSNLYDAVDASQVPDTALLASLGCGDPTALAELNPGETVLDLGSGGGIDVLLSARRVGPNGVAYGLDMTDEMLALAQENQRKSGLTNVHFRATKPLAAQAGASLAGASSAATATPTAAAPNHSHSIINSFGKSLSGLMLASQRLRFTAIFTVILTGIPKRSIHHQSTSIEDSRCFHDGQLSRSIPISTPPRGRSMIGSAKDIPFT